MLNNVDLALAVDPTEFGLRHLDRNPDDIPESFPEYQTGVIAYRNSNKFQKFIKLWEKYHKKLDIIRDQVSFRVVLFRNQNQMKFSALSLLYNYPVSLTQRVEGEVKIIHDTRNYLKTAKEIDEYSQMLNESDKERIIFGPGYGVKRFFAPLKCRNNQMAVIVNRLLFVYDLTERGVRSIQKEGLTATIRMIFQKAYDIDK